MSSLGGLLMEVGTQQADDRACLKAVSACERTPGAFGALPLPGISDHKEPARRCEFSIKAEWTLTTDVKFPAYRVEGLVVTPRDSKTASRHQVLKRPLLAEKPIN